MAWQELPAGEDIHVVAPNFYAVVAQVSTSHSKDDIIAQATKRGLNVFQYQEDAPTADGYRQVALQAQATSSGATIPWSPGFPASLAAHYHLTRAWWSPPANATPSDVTPPTSEKTTSNIGGIVVAVVLAAAVGGYLWYRQR